jgi:transcriptional regulator
VPSHFVLGTALTECSLVVKIFASGTLKKFLKLRAKGASQDELARIVAKMEEEEAGEDRAQKKRGKRS